MHAHFLGSDSSLVGQIMSLCPTKGRWMGQLVQAEGKNIAFDVHVSEEGAFQVADRALGDFATLQAVQITLTRGERVARGWVHMEALLGMERSHRSIAGALNRMISREATDDDTLALLDYVSMSAARHITLFNAAITVADENKGGSGDNQAEDEIVHVRLEEFAPIADPPGEDDRLSFSGISTGTAGGLDDLLAQIRCLALGHGTRQTQPARVTSQISVEDELNTVEGLDAAGENGGEGGLTRRLAHFEFEMLAIARRPTTPDDLRRAILCMLFETGMSIRLHRLKSPFDALEFMQKWLVDTTSVAGAGEKLQALEQHVVTASVLTVALAHEASVDLATKCHEGLERFYGGVVDQDRAAAALIGDNRIGFTAALSSVEMELRPVLAGILATPTRRRQLELAMDAARRGDAIPLDHPIFASSKGRELGNCLESPLWEKQVRQANDERPMCAYCYHTLPEAEARDLRRDRFARCIHCRKYTVNMSL